MFAPQRCCAILLLMALFPAPCLAQRTGSDLSGDPRVAWLRQNVHSLRTIDPADEDFSDLKALRPALDGVRLVLLGEADHGSGSDFLAKTRLVKFLHRKLGFDVLAFESPMYDMTVAWDRLRAGTPAYEAFWLGAGTWADAVQMQPLVSYVGKQARSKHPLEIAGFDHQHQVASLFYFTNDLAAFLEERGIGSRLVEPESPERAVLRDLSQVLSRYGVAPRPDTAAVRAFMAAVDKALAAVSTMSDSRGRQWAQNLRNVACYARFVWPELGIGSCNRDQQMAENLLWLANDRYPGRKIIVWAATLHTARIPKLSLFGIPDRWGGNAPSMGHYVGEALRSQSYVIAVTSYSGRSSRPDREIAVDQDSLPELEELMAATGLRYGLLDLRGAAKGSWLRGEFPARPEEHKTISARWSDLLDALVFVRAQEPKRDANPPAAAEAINDVRQRSRAAFLNGDADAYAAFFTDDTDFMPPGTLPLRGRAALRAWLQHIHEESAFSGGAMEILATVVVGNLAWDLYTATTMVSPKVRGEATEERRRGMHIYRREPDGGWRIAQETWNVIPSSAPR